MDRIERLSGRSEGVEPSVLGAAWRFRWLVASITVAAGLLAVTFLVVRPASYVAIASVLLEDPGAADVLESNRPLVSERIVANQLEVFRSTLVARRAAEIATERGVDVSVGRILSRAEVTSLRNTDVIAISFTSDSSEEARTVVASIVDAYEQVRQEQRREEADVVLERLDSAEEVLLRELDQVRAQIGDFRSRRSLDQEIDVVLDQMAEVSRALAGEADADARAALLARQTEVQQQLQALRLASELESERPELAALIRSRDDILNRLGAIASRKNEVEVEVQGAGTGIAFSSPPVIAESGSGAGPFFTVLAGLVIGGLLGLGAAYALAMRRRVFGHRSEPEVLLGVPFLADVPRFDATSAQTGLPVRDNPRSIVAEAFRFAASSLEVRLEQGAMRTVTFVSATVGDGKSTVVANTALASARSGKRVLVVDADFGNQALTRMLLGDISLGPGLTELVAGKVTIEDAIVPIEAARGVTFDLIGRGAEPVVAVDFFGTRVTQMAVSRLADGYDLVIVDSPPLLQVAYATTVARFTDSVVIVLRHGSSVRLTEDVADRLALIGADVLGYVYNQSPGRQDMVESGGSMKDVLGDRGMAAPVPPRQ